MDQHLANLPHTPPATPDQYRRAALQLARQTSDAAALREVLEMLGHPDLPEPKRPPVIHTARPGSVRPADTPTVRRQPAHNAPGSALPGMPAGHDTTTQGVPVVNAEEWAVWQFYCQRNIGRSAPSWDDLSSSEKSDYMIDYYRGCFSDGTEQPDASDHDPVNNPQHYTSGPKCDSCGETIECINITRHLPFNPGNAIKYLWRRYFGGKTGEDLIEPVRKAHFYLNDEIGRLEVDTKS